MGKSKEGETNFHVNVEEVADSTTVEKTNEGLTITNNEIQEPTPEELAAQQNIVETDTITTGDADAEGRLLKKELATMPDGVPVPLDETEANQLPKDEEYKVAA